MAESSAFKSSNFFKEDDVFHNTVLYYDAIKENKVIWKISQHWLWIDSLAVKPDVLEVIFGCKAVTVNFFNTIIEIK